MDIDLSIVTLVWNSERHVRTCFERTVARAEEAGLSWEFLVVDNGSTDATPEILAELAGRHPRLWVERLPENRGTTFPRNLALRRARGRHVCVLDSDAYPEPGCLETLIRVLEGRPEVGLAVPRLVYPDGRYQKSTDRVPTLPIKVRRALLLRRIEQSEAPPGPGPVEYAISAFWVFRRELLARAGYLDEKIFYAPEDVEFCLRVRRAGQAVWYEPSAVAVHDAQEKSRSLIPNRLTLLHVKGLLYLFWKYRFVWSAPRLQPAGAAMEEKRP
ncbi:MULTISPECIES: glycosyltransferase family 2 protein [Deferrisoma]